MKMVLINLSKLILMIQCIKDCPKDCPKRMEKLFDAYFSFKSTSDDLVSIEVAAELERLIEKNVDEEDEKRRKKILENIINIYTESNFEFPVQTNTIYLVPPIDICVNCQGTLVVVRPSRKGRAVLVYTKQGPRLAEVYHKYCTQCNCTVYYCYSEFQKDNILCRSYHQCPVKYWGITQETYFELALLEDLSEDVFTSDVRFVHWVIKYNRTFKNEETKLIKNRVFPAWLLFSINKRIPLTFRKAVINIFEQTELQPPPPKKKTKLQSLPIHG